MCNRVGKCITCAGGLLFACLVAGLAGLHAQAPSPRPQAASELGQKAIQRLILGQGFVAHPFGVRPFVRPQQTNDLWQGGASGNWNVAGSWSLGTVPGSGNNAVITTSGSTVTLNVAGSIAGLTIGGSDVLTFNNNNILTVTGPTITNSNSTGSGGLQFNSTNNSTGIEIGSAAVSLTGGGTVTMSNNTGNLIQGAASADVLTNVNNTIQGSGRIGAGQMGLVNQSAGVIDANQSSVSLTIQTSSGTTNTGTLEATAGGNLVLDGDTYTNTNGTISASGTNSVVTLQNPTINGGTLNTASGGLIQALGNPTLSGVSNKGTYQLPNSQNTTIDGTITNNGAIQLNGTSNNTNLILGANASLTGSGTVTLDNSQNNRIYGAVGTSILTNANNTIQGSGDIGVAQMGLVNQGTIDANQATALYIQ